MSQSTGAGYAGAYGTETQQTISDTDSLEALFGALEDEDCRAILEATSDESLTASELSERCELALSTAYRKLDMLTEAGLLEEQVRLSRSGKHTNEYVRAIEDVHVSMDGGEVELQITTCTRPELGSSVLAGAD